MVVIRQLEVGTLKIVLYSFQGALLVWIGTDSSGLDNVVLAMENQFDSFPITTGIMQGDEIGVEASKVMAARLTKKLKRFVFCSCNLQQELSTRDQVILHGEIIKAVEGLEN